MLDVLCLIFFGEIVLIPFFYLVYMWEFEKRVVWSKFFKVFFLSVGMFLLFWCDIKRVFQVVGELPEKSVWGRIVHLLNVFNWFDVLCIKGGGYSCSNV